MTLEKTLSIGERREALQRYLVARWPRLTILRLHLVLAWPVAASLVATVGAGAWVGPSTAPRDSTGYMLLWTLAALGVLVHWFRIQWRERPVLPRPKAAGVAWSPGVTLCVVLLALLPVYVAGYAADNKLRSLGDQINVAAAVKNLLPGRVIAGMRQGERQSLRTAPLSADADSARVLCVSLKSRLPHLCRKATTDAACVVGSVSEYLKTHGERLPGGLHRLNVESSNCSDEADPLRVAGLSAQQAVEMMARAHGLLGGHYARSVDPNYMVIVLMLALLLGGLCSGAGFVSRDTVITSALTLLVLAIAARVVSPLLKPLGSDAVSAANAVRAYGWPSYGVALVTLTVAVLRAPMRTPARDAMFSVLFLVPFFIPLLEWALVDSRFVEFLERGVSGLKFAVHERHRYFVRIAAGYIVGGILLTPVIDRYRRSARGS